MKLDRRRLKAKKEVALVTVTGNVFQTLMNLKKKLLAILLVRQKGFNRDEPNERVQIEEDVRIVKYDRRALIEMNQMNEFRLKRTSV